MEYKNKSIHIGQMIISNEIGGAENIVLNLTKMLIKNEIKTTMILNNELYPFFKDICDLNIINIGDVYKYRPFHNIYILLFSLYVREKLIKQISEERIDIIHIHLPITMILFSGIRNRVNAKSIFTIHGVSFINKDSLNPLNLIKNYILIKKFSKCTMYTSACNYFIDFFREYNFINDNYVIIPNGFDFNELNLIKELPLEGSPKLIFLGGTRHAKGGDLLVRSLNIIKDQMPNFKLYILRTIPKNHFIRKYVEDNNLDKEVIFVGYKRPPEYYQYIKSSDIFILPSRTEGIAASLLEAMALGKPIVATNVGGTPELIKQGVNGVLSSINPIDIANNIINLWKNPNQRESISNSNLEQIRIYDWNKIIKQYISLYQCLYSRT